MREFFSRILTSKIIMLCLLFSVLAEDTSTISTTLATESTTNIANDATTTTTATVFELPTKIITSATATIAAVTPSSEPPNKDKYFISDDIPTCRRNDRELNECIRRAFEVMFPRLKNGYEELNIPPLNPFLLNRTAFEYGNGRVTGRVVMKRAQVTGLDKLQFKDVDFKIIANDKTDFHMSAFVPQLNVVGDYKADVVINGIRLKPRGSFNVNINKINFNLSSEGSFYEKDSHRFVRLLKLELVPTIKGLRVNVTGLFPDPNINDMVLNLANQYWREIYRFVLPEVNRYLAPILLRLINQSLTTLPFDLVVKDV